MQTHRAVDATDKTQCTTQDRVVNHIGRVHDEMTVTDGLPDCRRGANSDRQKPAGGSLTSRAVTDRRKQDGGNGAERLVRSRPSAYGLLVV